MNRQVDTTLAVAETFNSIQGEGSTMGTPSVFLRLSHCNLTCSAWACDSTEVWKKVWRRFEFKELWDYYANNGFMDCFNRGDHLIVTGGEPTLWMNALCGFFESCPTRIPYTEVETNATIVPTGKFDSWIEQYNCSPKLKNAGNDETKRYKPDALAFYANSERGTFKFVIESESDIDEIEKDFINPFKIARQRIWLMPESVDQEELLRKSPMVAELCKKHGFNFSSRLQLILWNKCTGV